MGSLSQEHGPSRFLDTHVTRMLMSILGYQHKDMAWKTSIINPPLQPRLQRFSFLWASKSSGHFYHFIIKDPFSLGINNSCSKARNPKSVQKRRPWGLHPLILWIQKLCRCRSFLLKRPLGLILATFFEKMAWFRKEISYLGIQVQPPDLRFPCSWTVFLIDGYVERATLWWAMEPACSKATMSTHR